jgi:hypothetical protein
MRLPVRHAAGAWQATFGAGEALVRAVLGHGPSSLLSAGAPAAPCWPEQLVYELLDAHADTAELAAELAPDARWAAHLDYLRALQRTGREVLAQMAEEPAQDGRMIAVTRDDRR